MEWDSILSTVDRTNGAMPVFMIDQEYILLQGRGRRKLLVMNYLLLFRTKHGVEFETKKLMK